MKYLCQRIAILCGAITALSTPALAGPALNGNAQWQDGELGNSAGAAAAAALGLPGAQERYNAMSHNPGTTPPTSTQEPSQTTSVVPAPIRSPQSEPSDPKTDTPASNNAEPQPPPSGGDE